MTMARLSSLVVLGLMAVWLLAVGTFVTATTPPSGGCPQRLEHEVTLSALVNFTLGWSIDAAQRTITIRMRANVCNTWLGFGLSEAGHMLGSDIVTARMGENDQPVAEDRFVNWAPSPGFSPFPTLDICQDWSVVCASSVQGVTEFVLQRNLTTTSSSNTAGGGDTQDRNFVPGVLPVVFAWGLEQCSTSSSPQVADHGPNRGTVGIDFFASEPQPSFVRPADADAGPGTVLSVDYAMTKTTEYILRQFDLGEAETHLVAVNLAIRAEDRQFVHHILLHDCGNTAGAFPLDFIPANEANTLLTDSGVSPLFFGACQGLVFGYGLGGSALVFPNVTGYLLGGAPGSARFVVLEIHLDNPGGEARQIQSGIELFMTSKLREFNAATIVLGDASVRFGSIPPFQSAAAFTSVCPAKCTRTFRGDVHLTHSFPHMHMVGRELWTTIQREGEEGEALVVSSRKFWNFASQTNTRLDGVVVRPGDVLTTTCVYDTSNTASSVVFGQASQDEMCMEFVTAYPRENAVSRCGFQSPTSTSCGAPVLTVAQPGSDGGIRIPDLTGDVPATCDAFVEEGTPPSPATTLAPTESSAGYRYRHVSRLLFFVVIVILL